MEKNGGWTVGTLHEHIVALMRETSLRNEQRFQAQENATANALSASERRLEGMNEFRQQLTQQAATFISRVEFDARHNAMGDRLSELAERMNNSTGRSTGMKDSYGYVVGAIGILIAVASVVINLIT